MTGSMNIQNLLTLLLSLTLMSFTVACGENKKQEKKADNGVAQGSQKRDDVVEKEPEAEKEPKVEDEEPEEEEEEDDDVDSDSPGDLIAQITSLLTGQGGSGLDIGQLTSLLDGGGSGGLDVNNIISMITGAGNGTLDPSALQGALGGLDITQLQGLLSQLQP